MRSALLLASSILLLGAGCTALVDSTLAGRRDAALGMDGGGPIDTGVVPDGGPDVGPRDTGPDTGPPSACAGMPDGLHCLVSGIDEPFICLSGVCQLSRCGDGIADNRMAGSHVAEECDDGNSTPGDGCEQTCTFSCHAAADCDDMELCNGTETCGTMHTCEAGTNVPDAPPTACTVGGVTARCQGGACRAGMCGDGTLDAGEECDDHNLNSGDGCDMDCTYTCIDDAGCGDGNACNGNETCNVATHVCVAATVPLDCNDGDACTNDSCNATTGCVNASVLVDADADTHFAITASCGGDDCNDADGSIHPGAVEPCGSMVDIDCNGSAGAMTTFYRDCDGDDYAASTTGSVMACTEPAAAGGCTGGWTTRVPAGTTSTDCLDTSVGSSAHPGQAMYYSTPTTGLAPQYDYNCSGAASLEYATSTRFDVPPNTHYSIACSGSGRLCTGSIWYVGSTAPTCGGTATISYCTGTVLCTRTTRTGVAVACH